MLCAWRRYSNVSRVYICWIGAKTCEVLRKRLSIYQRRLPPRGAALEEVKPPTNVLVSPISGWNGVHRQLIRTSSATTATSAVSTSTVAATTATTISGHLDKARINLLLSLSEYRNQVTSLLLI